MDFAGDAALAFAGDAAFGAACGWAAAGVTLTSLKDCGAFDDARESVRTQELDK